MRITERVVGAHRAVATCPSVTGLSDGRVLATYRISSTKDCDDETIESTKETVGGRTSSTFTSRLLERVEALPSGGD